jgi:hypothetical protein
MLRVGDHSYPLCLLDTLAVSEMVKRPEGSFRSFLEWSMAAQPPFVPCFTVYTLMELRRKPDLFQQFIDQFHPFPCVLLKGYLWLLEDEVASYPDPSGIDPCALAFTTFGDDGNQLSNLPRILQPPQFAQQEAEWHSAGPEIVSGMGSLVTNYPAAGSTYTAEETRRFVWMTVFSQLYLHGHSALIERAHNGDGEAVDIDAFPTLKAMTYTVFHKFYADRNRKSSDSDAFDVLIAAALPYVEAVITENHMAEALSKTKRRDDFIKHLDVFTLRDFRSGPPGSLLTVPPRHISGNDVWAMRKS